MTRCAYCPFPVNDDRDALPAPGGGKAHGACLFGATLTAMQAGLLPPRASVLLRHRVSGHVSNNQPRSDR